MNYLILVLLVLLVSSHTSSEFVLYVKPTDSTSSCPGQPCLTFEQYASQVNQYFITGSTFLFLAGNHSVSTIVYLRQVSNMTFKEIHNESDVTIVCMIPRVLVLADCTSITVQGITFKLYEDYTPAYFYYFALATFDCQKIQFRNLTFEGSGDNKTLVYGAYCGHSNVEFISCLFKKNVGVFGGAIKANHSNVTLNRNVFIGNVAIISGGAIKAYNSNVTLDGSMFIDNVAMDHGGAILANHSNVTLDGNVFTNNMAMNFGGAILVQNSSLILKETLGNTFSHNVAMRNGGAIFLANSSIIIEGTEDAVFREPEFSCTNFSKEQTQHGPILTAHRHTTYFLNNEAHQSELGGGGAICILDSTARLSGTYIIFHNNSATFSGGGFYSQYSFITLNAKQSCFTKNRAGADGGVFFGDQNIVHITKSAYYAENSAGYVGGAHFSHNSTLQISGIVYLSNNYAKHYGGAMVITFTKAFFCGPAVHFVTNSADIRGGGLFMFYSDLQVKNCTNRSAYQGDDIYSGNEVHFINNTAGFGAIDIYYSNITFNGNVRIAQNLGGGISAIMLSTIYITGNAVFEENQAVVVGGGAIRISSKSTMFISGNLLFKNNTAIGCNGGAIFAADISTSIILHGNVTLIANRAENGGALAFENGANMILQRNTTITTSHNHASKYGGAIYHRDAITPSQCKFAMSEMMYQLLPECFVNLSQLEISSGQQHLPYSISSEYDSAEVDGNFLYGGLLDKCVVMESNVSFDDVGPYVTNKYEILYRLLVKFNIVKVTPEDTRPISSEAYELCFCENNQDFNCSEVKNIDTYRGRKFTVSVVALAQGDTATTVLLRAKLSITARLKQDQILKTHPQMCSEVSYNMYSSKEQEQLVLYPDGGTCHDIGMAQAVINIRFLPCPNAFTLSGDECICEERLQKYKPECLIYDNEIYISTRADSIFWMNVSYFLNGTYQGLILYQMCPIGYCKAQTINISLDNLNIQCDHNRSGLLCGACAANHSLMLGSSNCQECSDIYLTLLIAFVVAGIALVVFLSALRLTVVTGIINSIILYANILQANRNLLYPNSTDINSSVLTVFIAWMNLDLGFQTCFYHGLDAFAQTWLQFTFPIYVWLIITFIILASRYSIITTKLIGSNPIAVLATLLLLSYTKILKIIIEVYSSVKLDYPNNKTVTVWLKDANEPYLQSRHLVLTIITTLVLVFLFLPYTAFLLLGYKLYRLPGRRYFRWLNRIKPLLDCYYAPYKIHARYWTGLLLLVRCVLYFVFSFNSLGATTKSLLTIIVAFTAIMLWLSIRIYTGFYTNVIEGFVYLNLISLSAADLAGVNSPAVANSLVGIVFSIMVGIMVYQFYVVYVAKSASCRNLFTKLTSFMKNHEVTETTPLLAPIANPPTQRSTATSSTVSLREPLLTEN